jgi:hypothetical protein
MEGIGSAVAPRDPADYAYHTAMTKNKPNAYWRFLEHHGESRHADEAKIKLAKLLVEERDKAELLKYSLHFPSHKHLIVDVLEEIETVEKINEHLRTNLADGDRVIVRPGEIVYSRGYFKAYAGFPEEWEETGEVTYEIKLEQVISPKFIEVELLADQSFIMVEKFDALVNIHYRIKVYSDAPPGEYKATAIIGAYQRFSPDEDFRKGGKEAGLIVEVVQHPLASVELLEVDFEAAKYFQERQEKMQVALNDLKAPEGTAFGTQYMYKFNLANYTTRLAEYKTAQAVACYHLKLAAESSAPEIATQAQAVINKLQGQNIFLAYKPVK